jgi:hypothetical protein
MIHPGTTIRIPPTFATGVNLILDVVFCDALNPSFNQPQYHYVANTDFIAFAAQPKVDFTTNPRYTASECYGNPEKIINEPTLKHLWQRIIIPKGQSKIDIDSVPRQPNADAKGMIYIRLSVNTNNCQSADQKYFIGNPRSLVPQNQVAGSCAAFGGVDAKVTDANQFILDECT